MIMALQLQETSITTGALREMDEAKIRRLATVVVDSNDAIIISDFEGQITAWNRGAELMYGYSEKDALKMTLWQITPSKKAAEKKEFIRRLKAGEAITSFETQRETKDGRILDVWMTVTKLVDDAGKPVGIASTERDITGRKKKDEEFKSAKSLLDTVIDSSPFAMWISDREGLLIRTNRSLRETLNLTDEQLIGKYNVLNDANLEMQGVMPMVRAVFEMYKPASFIIPWKSSNAGDVDFKGGRDLYINVSIFPILDNNGELTNVVCQWVNITERKQAEEALCRSEELYRSTLDTMMEGCQIIGFDWRYLYVNDVVAKQGRLSADELVGRTMMECFPGIETTPMFDALRQCMKDRQPRQMENEFVYPGGAKAYFQLAIQPNPEGVFILSLDITDRKRAEEALRASEEKYRSMIIDLSEGFYSVRIDGSLLDHNREFNRILGFGPDENLIGAQLPDFWQHPEDRKAYLDELKKHGRLRNHPIAAKKRNGELIFVEANARIVADQRGMPAHIEGAFMDVTHRKQAEKAIQENEVKYRNLFDNAQVGMFRTKMDGSAIMEVNQNLLDVFGFTREEMLASPSTMRWAHPEEREEMARRLRADGVVTDLEAAFVTKAGGIRDFLISVKAYPGQGFLEGSGQDITERKRTEEAMRIAALYARSLIEASLDPLVTISPEGKITDVNEAAVKVTGVSRDKLIGTDFSNYFTEPDKAREGYQQVLAKAFVTDYPLTIRDKDGKLIEVLYNASVYKDVNGRVIGVFAAARDITERKRIEERVNQLNNELLQKNTELEQLIYVASHDLRSPLVNVQGFSREMGILANELVAITSQSGLPDRQKARISDIATKEFPEAQNYVIASVVKMDALLKGLLKISRLGRAGITLQKIDMDEMLSGVLKTLEFQIQKIKAQVDIAALPSCFGDPDQVNQVFTNIIDNALKYLSPERVGIIRITGKSINGFSEYCFEDNGIGIALEHQPKAFEIFHRLNPQIGEGEGLGLAIVKKIVSRLNGSVRLESEAGKGSKFFVSLPG
jgi:PAS domain S-box-containing protein